MLKQVTKIRRKREKPRNMVNIFSEQATIALQKGTERVMIYINNRDIDEDCDSTSFIKICIGLNIEGS